MQHSDPSDGFAIDERGFRGRLLITGASGSRHVRVEGERTDASGTLIQKDLPTERDPELNQLVERCVEGEPGAAVAVAAHMGILDPA